MAGLGFVFSFVFVFLLIFLFGGSEEKKSRLLFIILNGNCVQYINHTEKDLATAEILYLKFSQCEIVPLQEKQFVKLMLAYTILRNNFILKYLSVQFVLG